MKIALIYPPCEFLINEKVFPPLGLGYLSSYLKSNGYNDVNIYHITNNDNVPEIKADIIGIGFPTSLFNKAIDILMELKKQNSNSLFVAGGCHATYRPQECLDNGFDVVVMGEGEIALLDIVRKRENGETIERIISGKEIKNLDDIPFPDYEGLKIKDYVLNFKGKNYISMFVSRGCPMKCNFCGSPAMWKRLRLNSIEYIKKHIDYLMEKFHIEAIMFQDDVFAINDNRVKEIGGYLFDKGISYRCLVKANSLTKETIKILVDTGCVEVCIGIESGNQKMLDVMNKRTTVEQNRQALINCKEMKLSVKALVLLGIPGESKQSIEDTIRLIEEIVPEDVDANILVLYPGTEFCENIKDYDIKQEITDFDSQYMKGKIGHFESTISTSKITKQELEHYKELIFNKFSRLVKK